MPLTLFTLPSTEREISGLSNPAYCQVRTHQCTSDSSSAMRANLGPSSALDIRQQIDSSSPSSLARSASTGLSLLALYS